MCHIVVQGNTLKIRRNILSCLIGLLIVDFVLIYIAMFVHVPLMGDALVENVFALLIAILLIYPSSWLTHLKGGKHASYCAMGWVVSLCLLFCSVSWFAVYANWANRYQWTYQQIYDALPLLLTTMFIAAAVQVLALYLKQFKVLKLSAWLLFGLMGYFLLSSCIALVTIRMNRNMDLLLAYSWCGTALGLLAVCICVGPWRWHKLAGLGVLLNLSVMLALDVSLDGMPESIPDWIGLCLCVVIAWAHGNILWQLPLGSGRLSLIGILTKGLVVCVCLLVGICGCLLALGWGFQNNNINGLLIVLAAAIEFIAVMITCALLFYLAMNRIRINRKPADNQINYSTMQVVCPHCQTHLHLTESGESCTTCGMEFHFHLIEPRCPKCHYLLIGNVQTNCPECGTEIDCKSAQPVGEPD